MNLETTYMGIELRNPLVASASPLSQTVDGIRRLEEAGVGAVVLYSLFEEELRREAEPSRCSGRPGRRASRRRSPTCRNRTRATPTRRGAT